MSGERVHDEHFTSKAVARIVALAREPRIQLGRCQKWIETDRELTGLGENLRSVSIGVLDCLMSGPGHRLNPLRLLEHCNPVIVLLLVIRKGGEKRK